MDNTGAWAVTGHTDPEELTDFNILLTILSLEKFKGIKSGNSVMLLLAIRTSLLLVKYQVTSDDPKNTINSNDNYLLRMPRDLG